ncbi:hypothetical protein C0V75_12705 [Tabrizicola sp. TH137]|uniref:hypothetical protein n=1 Tax=Tabrizicola sp. TH137 TaxID=2067452 RepID=UPI000C7C6653|nr:hypothetical protein [Tabrizicola sp. TH137]PLL11769.1 hypothetical protein C0V75_12705 [Tabrizicola sp. TH137]
MALVFIVYPLAIYLSLCLLPKARAGVGILLAAAALALVWFTSDPAADDGYARFLVMVGVVPVVTAALAQGLRRLIPEGAPVWVWPVLAVGLALSALSIFFMLL